MAATDYISKEIDKVINDESLEFPKNVAMACAWIIGNLKGVNLKILSVKEKSSLADYFVLGSANNPVQAKSMSAEIINQLKKHGFNSRSNEGVSEGDWILLDIGDVIIHIFLEHSRDFYDLDTLWSEAESIEIPQEYYYSEEDEGLAADAEKEYF
jgi:ribosome-associated protein